MAIRYELSLFLMKMYHFDKKFLNSNRYLRSYKFEFNCLNIIS
ncbi:hypothetical protein PARMER_03803 [Parabacteroides merdae ATCC 43184]|nr:hypothetical protein PARMER_03803 [Parabacteroides merdae ATCC 43184]